jgi:SAM-dependent methyltransferase
MNPEEYAKLDRLDRDHWFYRGKRAIVRHWIERSIALGKDDLLIDAGMGTGTWVVEMSGSCRVLGLDDHEESLALARPRLEAVGGQALKTSLDRIALSDGCASVVTALDVLEHLDDDAKALSELVRLTRPGGLVVITVPALMQLWSDWDVALHHRRRYHRAGLRELIGRFDVEVLRCAYFNAAALPLIWLVRSWRKLAPPRPGADRAEDRIPSGPVNALLYHAMVTPARWSWFKPPAGVSLLAVLRRCDLASDRPIGSQPVSG